MSLEKNPVNFDDIVSNVEQIKLDNIKGIDINQVDNLRSFLNYFKLEFGTYIVATLIAAYCYFFREDAFFPDKTIYITSLFVLFLLFLNFTFSFSLILKQEDEYKKIYMKNTGKKLDKTKQIKERFGWTGYIIYMLITFLPFALIYSISYM